MALHVLDAMAREGFEEVLAVHDRDSGLRAFVGVHDTAGGPAFGGIRRFPYPDERSGLMDVLRLSLAMSQKCALADLAVGGGKIVVLDRPDLDLEGGYRHLGRVIASLGGRYYAGPDVGTGERELAWVAAETEHCTPPGAEGLGNLPAATAAGVFGGLAAALAELDGEPAWAGRTVVLQGLGRVGEALARRLVALDVKVLASELDEERAQGLAAELGLELLEPGTEFDVPSDAFCPCAMGGILHDVTIQRLRARIVCGAANNPLGHARHGRRLHERGILYVPDIVVNAGAVIRGAEYHLNGRPTPLAEIEVRIGALAADVLREATRTRQSPVGVALREAARRLEEGQRRRGDRKVTERQGRDKVRDDERAPTIR